MGASRRRRIEVRVSDAVGARLDRLAEVYRTKHAPGANLKARDALRAVLHVGLAAEEARLGLAPLKLAPESAREGGGQ
jgi:predicted transcriptional regulator